MHTGRHDHFVGFSFLLESLCQIADDWVPFAGIEGRHVKPASDFLSAAPDMGLAVPLSAGAIPGDQSGQSRDFLAVELPQFGQIADQHGAGLRSDAGGTLDDAVSVFEVLVRIDLVPDKLINFQDLEVEGFDHFPDTLFDFRVADHGHSIGLLGAQIVELPSSSDQLGQFAGLRGGMRFGHGFDHFCESGQEPGINGIGLGMLADAFGKITHLTRIDNNHVHPGTEQLRGKRAFVTPGGFQDDQVDGMRLEGLAELAVSFRGVGQIQFEDRGAGRDTECVFGDIDSDIDRLRHGTFPFLRMRTRRASGSAAVQTAVRAIPTRATRFPLRVGLVGPVTIELSSPAGVVSARCAPLGAGLRSAPRTATGFPYETITNHVCQHTRKEGPRRFLDRINRIKI